MALTGGGSRLYLSTRSNTENNPSARPQCLRLVFIRLPPGFAPSGPTQKPTKVNYMMWYFCGMWIKLTSLHYDIIGNTIKSTFLVILFGSPPDSNEYEKIYSILLQYLCVNQLNQGPSKFLVTFTFFN